MLAEIFRAIHCMCTPATSSEVERVWSTWGLIMTITAAGAKLQESNFHEIKLGQCQTPNIIVKVFYHIIYITYILL